MKTYRLKVKFEPGFLYLLDDYGQIKEFSSLEEIDDYGKSFSIDIFTNKYYEIEELDQEDLVYRLRRRAERSRNIKTRKWVQEGKPDLITDLLEEAADRINLLETKLMG